MPRKTFSATVSEGTSLKCWWTMPMPAAMAAAGLGRTLLLAIDEDLALVRLQQPEQDVHQRRLAGAVLADDRVDLAALDGEVHILVGDERAEPLGDRFQLDGERHGWIRGGNSGDGRDRSRIPWGGPGGAPARSRRAGLSLANASPESRGTPSPSSRKGRAQTRPGDRPYFTVATMILPATTSALSSSSFSLTSAGILSTTCGQSSSSTPPDSRS